MLVHPDLALYYIEQYLERKRRIAIQALDSERGAIARSVPYADGTRFLVLRGTQAVYQSDDPASVLAYIDTHDGCTVMDLAAESLPHSSKRMIGKYMAPRDPQRAISPVFDPNAGKNGKFGLTHESLLKDRKPSQVLPEPKDATPFEDRLLAAINHKLDGTPLIGQANRPAECPKCGYTVSCKCNPVVTYHTPPADVPYTGRYRPIPLAELWIRETL